MVENSRWVPGWRPDTQCTCSQCRHLWQLPPTPSSRQPHAWLPVYDKTQRCFSRCRLYLHKPLAKTGKTLIGFGALTCGVFVNASRRSSLLFALWPLDILPELLCAAPVLAFGHCTSQEAAKLKIATLWLTADSQQYHQASAFDRQSLKTQVA